MFYHIKPDNLATVIAITCNELMSESHVNKDPSLKNI